MQAMFNNFIWLIVFWQEWIITFGNLHIVCFFFSLLKIKNELFPLLQYCRNIFFLNTSYRINSDFSFNFHCWRVNIFKMSKVYENNVTCWIIISKAIYIYIYCLAYDYSTCNIIFINFTHLKYIYPSTVKIKAKVGVNSIRRI